MDKFNIELNERPQKGIGAKISKSFIKKYADFTDKPSINDIELDGNVTLSKLGIQPAGDYADNQKVNMLESSIPTDVVKHSELDAVDRKIPTDNNQLTNGAGYITNSALSPYAQKNEVVSLLSTKQDISAKSDLYKINYEVVGNVDITPDGIASGFSTTSYLKTFKFKPDSNPWKMRGRVKSTDVSHYNVILWGGSYEKRLLLRSDEFKFFLGNSVRVLQIAPSSIIVNNQSIWFEVEYTGSQYISRYKTNVDDEFVIHEIVDGWVFPQNDYQWWIGSQGSNNYQFDGDVYLNEFKIYIDGQLVYQPYVATGYASSKAVSDGYAELDAKIEELRALITGV